MLDTAGLGQLIRARKRQAFRLQTLDAYDVGSDGGDVARYLSGERDPDPRRKEQWLARLRAEQDQGKTRLVVHVVHGPLSPYLRYACEWGYRLNVAAAPAVMDVRILDLAERPRPAGLDVDHDFWLLDDQVLIRMHYDPEGRFLGAELLEAAELPRYRAARDAALGAAEVFGTYWRRHPQYHRANQAA
jgi:hypothetical protein